jgi:hypothetical protein
MVNFPKMAHLHGTLTKKILFSWEIFKYGNISVALMIKIPMLLQIFFFHVTITQPVLGKFPIKVKIPMTISNSVCAGRLEHVLNSHPQKNSETRNE